MSEYKRPEQFVTHNFDFEWRGYSYGVQPDVNHFKAAKKLTMAGVDIYHPTQDDLTGIEIAFGGDMTRCLKNDNYLVLETEAQGYPGWTPYKGQLRLQAYSHLASGANGVMYWHWHSIHNSFETYWKGILSHDFKENAVYKEAESIGNEWAEYSDKLCGLKKENKVAIMVSNEALTALNWFGIEATAAGNEGIRYNDVVRWGYDALYKMNVECDFIWPESQNIENYDVIVLPALYAVEEKVLNRLKEYVKQGGTLVSTFKTGFANENVKVYADDQPHNMTDVFGMHYQQFTFPKKVTLSGMQDRHPEAKTFMELLVPDTANVLSSYEHYNWKEYAAITENQYGDGYAYHIGCMFEEVELQKLFRYILEKAGVSCEEKVAFPLIIRKGKNAQGKEITFYLNYSENEMEPAISEDEKILIGHSKLEPWGVCVTEK